MSSFSFSLFLFPSCLYLLQRFFLHSLCFLLQTSLSFCTHSLLFFCGGHLLLCLLTRFWAMRMLSFLSTVPRFTCVLLLHVGSLIAKKAIFLLHEQQVVLSHPTKKEVYTWKQPAGYEDLKKLLVPSWGPVLPTKQCKFTGPAGTSILALQRYFCSCCQIIGNYFCQNGNVWTVLLNIGLCSEEIRCDLFFFYT